MQKAYEPTVWENKPSINTPLNKRNLDKLSQGVSTIDDRVITHELTKFDKVDAQSCINKIDSDETTVSLQSRRSPAHSRSSIPCWKNWRSILTMIRMHSS